MSIKLPDFQGLVLCLSAWGKLCIQFIVEEDNQFGRENRLTNYTVFFFFKGEYNLLKTNLRKLSYYCYNYFSIYKAGEGKSH